MRLLLRRGVLAALLLLQRHRALGVGRRLADARDSAEMTAALETILAQHVRERGAAFRAHFGQDDPAAAVCDQLESLA